MRTNRAPSARPPLPHQARQNRPPQQQRPNPLNGQVKPISTPPKRTKSKLLEPLSFGFGGDSPGAERAKGSGDPFVWLTIAFLVFFLLISWSTVRKTERSEAKVQSSLVTSLNSKEADTISERIATQVNWMNTALAMRGNARQTVNVAARGPNVTAAAVLDSSGNVIASLPAQGTGFSNIPAQSLPKSGIAISYLLSEGGASNPLIILKSNDTYLVNQLTPGSLIGQNQFSEATALIDRGGNPIDSSTTVAVNGVPGAFALAENVITQLANSTERHNSISTDSGILTAISVPNTNLTLLSRGEAPNVSIPNNIVIFVLLFLFTAVLLSALLRAALNRFSTVQATHADGLIRQERYQVAVAGGRGGVWEIDLQNNNVYLNQSLAKLFGLADEDQELSIAQFLSLIHRDDRDRLLATLRRTHLAGEMDVEVRVAHLPVVVHCRGQSSYRAVTNNTVIVGVAMDITEQRGAQARLQATEARLYDSLNSMSNSLNRLVLWNGKFESFFGFKPGQLQLGMNKDMVEQQAQNNIAEFFEVEDDNDEIEIKLNDGRWLRYSEATTADGSQVSIGNDITEIRSREQELRENEIALRNTVSVLKKSQTRIMELAENYEQEKIRAEEASQSKSDFLANMSHELRTPLNAINGFSDIMKKEMFGPLGDSRYKEYVNDILFSGQHLLSLINDILAGPGGIFVAQTEGQLAGFAAYDQFRKGPGYAYAMEHSIVISEGHRGQNIGSRLLTAIENDARQKGYRTMIGGISSANPRGEAFHKAMGYHTIGTLKQVGFKNDQWLDLTLMQKIL